MKLNERHGKDMAKGSNEKKSGQKSEFVEAFTGLKNQDWSAGDLGKQPKVKKSSGET